MKNKAKRALIILHVVLVLELEFWYCEKEAHLTR